MIEVRRRKEKGKLYTLLQNKKLDLYLTIRVESQHVNFLFAMTTLILTTLYIVLCMICKHITFSMFKLSLYDGLWILIIILRLWNMGIK